MLLLPLSVSAGDLNGTSLICDSERFDDDVYIADRTEIRWEKTMLQTLDRQALELVVSMKKLPALEEWQCNVYLNEADYWGQLENIRKQQQRAAAEVRRDNNI